MAEKFEDIFGVEFQAIPVSSYQTFPSVDGSHLGLELTHPDGSKTRLAFGTKST